MSSATWSHKTKILGSSSAAHDISGQHQSQCSRPRCASALTPAGPLQLLHRPAVRGTISCQITQSSLLPPPFFMKNVKFLTRNTCSNIVSFAPQSSRCARGHRHYMDRLCTARTHTHAQLLLLGALRKAGTRIIAKKPFATPRRTGRGPLISPREP